MEGKSGDGQYASPTPPPARFLYQPTEQKQTRQSPRRGIRSSTRRPARGTSNQIIPTKSYHYRRPTHIVFYQPSEQKRIRRYCQTRRTRQLPQIRIKPPTSRRSLGQPPEVNETMKLINPADQPEDLSTSRRRSIRP